VAHRVRACLRPPFVIDDITHNMSGTIGIGLCPTHAEDADRLFACADVAISTAKSNSSGVEVYDRLKGLDVAHRLATARQLRVAVASGQFVLHYQPKVDIRSGAVVGVEALVRWEHPDAGLQYPDSFLPIVEQIGCMPALTRLVLEAAISQRREWYLDGIALTMAVNLSASNLDDPDLVTDIALMLVGAGVPSDALELEITETNLMIDPLQAKTTLEALHALGIGLSVDDYGTGFSSLQYIRDLPVHELKIDRTFVTGMSDDDRNRAIVRSTIQLGHALGLRVVGEGVETRDDLALLERLGCDSAQGYYLCKPWPAAQLSRWLHANHSQSDAVL
jgi:EAL domain-containing protein (putative c-di-GMP-specific phosphodiesterase class I)